MIKITLILIIGGIIIMLLSIIKLNKVHSILPLIKKKDRKWLTKKIIIQQILMLIFLLGYTIVALTITIKMQIFSELVVSSIFLLGSCFVYTGVLIDIKISTDLTQTLAGLLPICAKCKRIRKTEADSSNMADWEFIDTYLAINKEASFTHGLCPKCYKEIEKKI